jgi:hypothetical protein
MSQDEERAEAGQATYMSCGKGGEEGKESQKDKKTKETKKPKKSPSRTKPGSKIQALPWLKVQARG